MSSIEAARHYYAQLVTGHGGVRDPRVTDAFATTPRERFVGAGPWTVFNFAGGYIETPSDDHAWLYQDVLVALSRGQGINNGMPSLHARCLDALALNEGETVLHVGTGTGYYTSILAALVGPAGSVVAYEIEPALLAMAKANLAGQPNVSLQGVSGTSGSLPPCDAIYVNAGATHPVDTWLDDLRPGGRLLFPLTPDQGLGGMLLVTRGDGKTWPTRFVCPAGFIPCHGARDPQMAAVLADAFRRQSLWTVQTLHRGTVPDDSCWVAGNGWWLSTR
ncbi:MAG: protein-L-isoaspartate O-methyltransferase [Reyranella sp.]|uniref:protein-L-isoaspartate O-methyltransferase family protein n=1 Tax=Reyranella sp. TaxID=1929291 RepID=UPI003D0C6895